jgi:hypothetical protein
MASSSKPWLKIAALALVTLASAQGKGAPIAGAAEEPAPHTCRKIVLTGEVSAGREWKAPFGEGWVFRMLPIPREKAADGVGGWDLVIDREDPAGFPDALLVANPPYNLINSREVGTSFGLRAQDAIGWNPRQFHFMTNRNAFRQAQKLYLLLDRYGQLGGKAEKTDANGRKQKALKRAMQRFDKLARESSPGEFRILDARLTPGADKPKPYAANWAFQSASTPHTDEVAPGGAATPLGSLEWIQFSVALWVPGSWRAPMNIQQPPTPCPK